jgi:branched-chain amino acid transport system permease protein
MQHFLITPMLKSNNHLNMVFLTIGFSILFQNAAQILWTSNYRTITTAYNKNAIMLGDIGINFSKLVSFVVCVLIAYGLFLFYKKTTLGKMVRATSLNATGAKLVGIKINWIYLFTFCLGSALAGVAGSLLLPFFYAYPTVGSVFGTRSFAVVMLGGLGNMKGAFIAGILIGILETVSAMFLGSSFQDAVVSIAFLVVLIVRHRMQVRRAR